ncbi:MAG: biopolymer transporter ExbD [Opitutae bacterium]|jgi:biopolymer transport protein ExbD|nr:biopolymer transporter ExbD [Opitutae bacterium]MBT5908244.1 biopolymer transporter ExbD [Opitutae bacterium]MBT6852541.1 biopolymer transporter ExbD [Opitutae bacterium]MBT7923475.1 biopolymer transporter ExbD [Opitutae bacterium]
MFKKRKQGRTKKHRKGDIPTGSFSDIAFLLIIYFLVATTLVKVKSITADLPAGEKSNQTQSEKTPVIRLSTNGIRFNDKDVDVELLNERLAALELLEKEESKRTIMLESEKGTPYDLYFQAFAAISSNGGLVALVEEE